MEIKLHKNFQKHFLKLTESQKKKFRQRRDLFLQDELNPILNNHSLRGNYLGYRSINVTGDLRIIFRKESNGNVMFVELGSHSNLYG